MRIKFDPNQQHQVDAVSAVCELFKGQPKRSRAGLVDGAGSSGDSFTELGVANRLLLSDSRLLENVQSVQRDNGVRVVQRLQGRNFSVEMETGTGKTYVYLRTAFELNARYGFKKFIVVVPTVAIREGVLKNVELTRDHFADLYGSVPVETWVYDSEKLSALRQFAASNQLQFLILNIDAFNKAANVINNPRDELSGRKPIEFVQACRPVVIVDEPQNMESILATAAIASLNPLCTLRYSATHRNPYNLVYRLDPVRAYDLRLVKRIEVDSVTEEGDLAKPYIGVESVEPGASRVVARLWVDVRAKQGVSRKLLTISKNGVDLAQLAGGREVYNGYVVDHLDAGRGYVAFSNGVTLGIGETHGARNDDIMRAQVRETVREHFEKELAVRRALPAGQRLKVLSLFFIDRVANYIAKNGKIRRWFEEAYAEFAKEVRFKALKLPPTQQAHSGYFAESKGRPIDSTGNSAADEKAYALIMRDKEQLLSLDEPLRFIFSHSALREGWDNPNVFQICTLNETRSDVKKRQEIGRGLRLPVNEAGVRCLDPAINRLTVVANETYDSFARQLQTELEEDCGVNFGARIGNRRQRQVAKLKKGWKLDSDFLELWRRIKHKTRYSVDFSSTGLVKSTVKRIAVQPRPKPAKVVATKTEIGIEADGVSGRLLSVRETTATAYVPALPDFIGTLQRETELTRETLAAILIESGRLSDAIAAPEEFLDQTLGAIRQVLRECMVDGIKYERVAGEEYEMRLFEEHELESYLSRMLKVKKSIHDYIEFESATEEDFAKAMDARDDIRLFVKLPAWFQVETPLGTYNPDWAIVKQGDRRIYLVRETKSSLERLKLRGEEWGKIECGKAHFTELGVDFAAVTSAKDV